MIHEGASQVWHKTYGPIWSDEDKMRQIIRLMTSGRLTRNFIDRRVEASQIFLPYAYFITTAKISPMIDRVLIYLFHAYTVSRVVTGSDLVRSITMSMDELFKLHQELDEHEALLRHVLDTDQEDVVAPNTVVTLRPSFIKLILGTLLEEQSIEKGREYVDKFLGRITEATMKEDTTDDLQSNDDDLLAMARDDDNHDIVLWQVITPAKTLDQLVLGETLINQVNELLAYMKPSVQKTLRGWGQLKNRNKYVAALLFGAPGVGKSALAEAVGAAHGAKLLKVDSSGIINKYVGETEKATRQVFLHYAKLIGQERCRRHDDIGFPKLVLWLDEADQLFSRRITITHSTDATHNRMQNILLEELTKFNGVLIATTNNMSNFDPAYARRFNFKIECKMPTQDERAKMWMMYLGEKLPLHASVTIDLLSARELSGAQIEQVVYKTALHAAAQNQTEITLDDFDRFIKEEAKIITGLKAPRVVGFNH